MGLDEALADSTGDIEGPLRLWLHVKDAVREGLGDMVSTMESDGLRVTPGEAVVDAELPNEGVAEGERTPEPDAVCEGLVVGLVLAEVWQVQVPVPDGVGVEVQLGTSQVPLAVCEGVRVCVHDGLRPSSMLALLVQVLDGDALQDVDLLRLTPCTALADLLSVGLTVAVVLVVCRSDGLLDGVAEQDSDRVWLGTVLPPAVWERVADTLGEVDGAGRTLRFPQITHQ